MNVPLCKIADIIYVRFELVELEAQKKMIADLMAKEMEDKLKEEKAQEKKRSKFGFGRKSTEVEKKDNKSKSKDTKDKKKK